MSVKTSIRRLNAKTQSFAEKIDAGAKSAYPALDILGAMAYADKLDPGVVDMLLAKYNGDHRSAARYQQWAVGVGIKVVAAMKHRPTKIRQYFPGVLAAAVAAALSPNNCYACFGRGGKYVENKYIKCDQCKEGRARTPEHLIRRLIGMSEDAWHRVWKRIYRAIVHELLTREREGIDEIASH